MNVAIHECYDTSICNPVSLSHTGRIVIKDIFLSVSRSCFDCVQTTDISDQRHCVYISQVTTTVSARASQKSARAFLPSNEGKDS